MEIPVNVDFQADIDQILARPQHPGSDDVKNVVTLAHRAKRVKLDFPNAISDEGLSDLICLEKRVIEERFGAAVAPPWFEAANNLIMQRLDGIVERMDRMETRVYNGSATLTTDLIIPPRMGANDPQENFPQTVNEINNLNAGALFTSIENYYQLLHTGNVETRKKRIRRAYGVGMTVN